MKKLHYVFISLLAILFITGCNASQYEKDKQAVDRQQSQYATGQPIPAFDWSLERHLVIELYKLRNMNVATHTVWRSNTGIIEGDCPSMGFSVPFDTSLTNPLKRITGSHGAVAVEQAEPNGIFASKNTAATWVMCVNETGQIEPIYIETKVTTYPYPLLVDYDQNRVLKAGKATATISSSKPVVDDVPKEPY